MLGERTGKPVHLMPRGVDTNLFSPSKRFRQDGAFTLGFAGRLQPEKNVRLLVDLQKQLPPGNHRFLIVGDGFERSYLSRRLRRAEEDRMEAHLWQAHLLSRLAAADGDAGKADGLCGGGTGEQQGEPDCKQARHGTP